jgi:hypothetical protein
MKLNIHIERLILDGLPLEKRHAPQVKATMEKELSRLLAAHGLGQEWRSGGAVPKLRASGIQLWSETQPSQLGRQIAGSAYSIVGRRR